MESTSTRPAGTSTAHRPDRLWSDRAASAARRNPTTRATVPATTRPSARRSGPPARPAATSRGATGNGPSHSTGGVRRGYRRSSPYATPLPHANETAGSPITSPAATTVATSATTAGAASALCVTATIAASATKAGATTRRTVSPIGCGASNASNDVAHAAHNKASASVRGGVDQPASASPAAGPAVSGSDAHANRTNHSVIGAIGLRGLWERSIYYGPHGRRP